MRRLLATTAIATLAAMPLYAQSDSNNDTTASTEQQQMASNDPSMTSGDLEIRGSELVGKPIYVPGEGSTADEIDVEIEWERAGEIGDIILSQDGQLKSVTLDVGGFLGMGEKVVDTSMDELKFVADSDDEGEYFIVFNGDRSVLEDREEFDQAAAEERGDRMMSDQSDTDMASSDQTEQMNMSDDETDTADSSSTETSEDENATADASSTTDDMSEEDTAAADTSTTNNMSEETTDTASNMSDEDSTTMAEDGNQMASDDQMRQTQETLSSFTADELEGMPVYGSEGDRVGEVERIILTQEGEVETIVVDVGGFLGLGEKPVAVSLDQLLAGEDEANGEMRLSVNHTEEELESMEAWEE